MGVLHEANRSTHLYIILFTLEFGWLLNYSSFYLT